MVGPIDYIVVGFEGNKFDGSILKALSDTLDKGIIRLIALSVVARDNDDQVINLDIANTGDSDEFLVNFVEKYKPQKSSVDIEDINEVADLINKNCAAGLLVIEHLWAKPLKQAIIDANGVLLADGRIHSEAAEELEV